MVQIEILTQKIAHLVDTQKLYEAAVAISGLVDPFCQAILSFAEAQPPK